ncbi:MAG: ABC-F family ATP-binding cassette domain-containing protein [Bacilli bacterium]
MDLLEIKNLKFSYSGELLFNNASLRIFENEHVGLVGKNGAGKTTLINIMCHKLVPDGGSVEWDKSKSFSYLDQHLQVQDNVSVLDYLHSVYTNLYQKEEEMNRLYDSLADTDDMDKALNKAEKIQEELEKQGFYQIKSKINNIINGLGIDIGRKRTLKELSGGQRVKVFLGKMLLEEKDVLLLDEPTNFLDVNHIEWLEKFLITYKNAFIVISHSKEFLNKACNVIVDLDNRQLVKYKGNYDAFIAQKEFNDEVYIKQYEKQQKEIKKTKEFISKNITRASTTKRAQSRRKQLDKIKVMSRPEGTKKVNFRFPFTKSFNVKVLGATDLVIGYDAPILQPLNVAFEFGGKYVITGDNGIGKSTFLKTILGEIPALSGKCKLSKYNDVLYFAQEIIPPDVTPIEYIREDYPKMDNTKIRTLLGTYGISGEMKPMKSMSGGEIAKTRFAKLSLIRSNLLILDEPTSHLDKISRKSLFKSLSTYEGTIILVSHEKEFYKELKMEEISFEGIKR